MLNTRNSLEDRVKRVKLILKKRVDAEVEGKPSIFIQIYRDDGYTLLRSLQISSREERLPSEKIMDTYRMVKRYINYSGPVDSRFIYRLQEGEFNEDSIAAIRQVFQEGIGYLDAVKIDVTKEEIFLVKRLRELGLRFSWKIYKEDSWLDLFFGEKGIIVNIIDDACRERLEDLKSRFKKYRVYWIKLDEVRKAPIALADQITKIVLGEEVRPNGTFLTIDNVEKYLSHNIFKILIICRVGGGPQNIKSAKVFLKTSNGYVGIGELKPSRETFEAQLVDVLHNARLYYSYKVGDYRKIYAQLIRDYEAIIYVEVIPRKIFRMITWGETPEEAEATASTQTVQQIKKSKMEETPPESTTERKIEKKKIIEPIDEELLRKVVSKSAQLLRDDIRTKLELIPLEIIRSFIEKFVYKTGPMSNEELEELISYGLVDKNRKRTLIGRIVKKVFKEIIGEHSPEDSEPRN